jgi:hypothetical protein
MAKAMGLGAMFLLLVIAVVVLPIIVRYIDHMEPQYIISGFQDVAAPADTKDAVATPSASQTYRMTENGRYMCNSPNGNGQSCPEGTFCDAATQSCIATYMGGPVPDTGYFA